MQVVDVADYCRAQEVLWGGAGIWAHQTFTDINCMYFADEIPPQPVCWRLTPPVSGARPRSKLRPGWGWNRRRSRFARSANAEAWTWWRSNGMRESVVRFPPTIAPASPPL